MTVLATGVLNGHEARGVIALVQDEAGARIELTDLWVAPGAPDVRIYVTPRSDAQIDETATDLGPLADQQTGVVRALPSTVDPHTIRAVVIYCKIYSVMFGSGALTAKRST